MMTGLGLTTDMHAAEATLSRELERVRHLRRSGALSAGEASDAAARAYRQRDAELHRLLDIPARHECAECGAVGSVPAHRVDCPRRQLPGQLVLPNT